VCLRCVLLLSLAVTAGCHGSAGDAAPPQDAGATEAHVAPPDARPQDAPDESPIDADTEAPMPMPLALDLGGPKLTAPRLVTVSFSNDDPTLVASLESFDDSITTTAWWTAVASEYGVGPGGGGGHVVLPMAASSGYTDSVRGGDSSVRQLIQTSVASGILPTPDAQTLYVVYFPAGTILRLDGLAACAGPRGGGWHDDLTVSPPDAGAPVDVAYAVVPRCASDVASMTLAASHEIVESATDPSPENAPAVQMTDPAWLAFGPEVADVCFAIETNLSTPIGPYLAQRSWSNAAAQAGHDPCVPSPPGTPYFNVAPAAGAEVLGLAVGESATFAVYAVSDGDAGSWQVQPVVANGSTTLVVTLDHGTLQSGDRALATVTLQSPPTPGTAPLYGFVSSANGATYVRPMLIAAK
jgi:hypothetical protein